MEGFSYVDIYATKGIEYLIVIGFLLAVGAFFKFLAPPSRRKAVAEAIEHGLANLVEWFLVPEGYHFHQGHTWARRESEDVVKVGVDDFAQKLVGKVDGVNIPALGAQVSQGEPGWTLSVDSRAIPMLSPVEGRVVSVNQEVLSDPEILNKDPYGAGWLFKVKAPRLEANLKSLLSGKLARRWIEERVDSLRSRSQPELGVLNQDGGLPVQGMARSLEPQKWEEVVKEYFLSG